MRFSARAFIFVFCLAIVAFSVVPSYAFAQSNSTVPATTTTTNPYINPYNVPNTEANVPANQHTRVQTLMIDMLSASMCILIGIDPVDKTKPCLDVNPQTGKIGYKQNSFDENGQPQLGGILGASSTMIGMLYTPTISTNQYSNYLARNFSVVKPAYAQDAGYGFTGLDSLLLLWTAVRNMAYFLLMLAFVIIGLGIMLRIKIDPRTVMTLQNQIPRIIICILLVTFSYPIIGALIDTMWLTTYVGINVITTASGVGPAPGSSNPIIPGNAALQPDDPNRNDRPLSETASANLLQMPITYVNQVFRSPDTPASGNTNIDSGLGHITDEVSYSIGQFMKQLVMQLLGTNENESCISWSGVDLTKCLANVLGFLAEILLWLIILITLLKTLFNVWFSLIKAYTYVIIYTIISPIFIVLGLLPGGPLGFEKLVRSVGANLVAFPVTAWSFVGARSFVELFREAGPDRFIPPLVGNPNIIGLMGWIIAFGIILLTPTILTQLQETLKVPGNKYGGAAIGGAIAAGAAAPKAISGTIWNRATRKAKYGEHDAGWLRRVAAGKGNIYDTKKFSLKDPKSWVDTIQRARSRLASKDSSGGSNFDDKGRRKF